MSTQGWIKMSERKPTASECEAGVTIGRWKDGAWQTDNGWHHDEWGPGWTHFHVPRLPEPPAKELTQRELDEEALREWNRREYRGSQVEELVTHCESRAWHAAIAYRDGQNREDLSGKFPPSVSTVLSWGEVDAINNLKRRCGLDQ